jgi:Raf kinase inhibitor-like YbhB/YbcL family protein
MRRIAFALAVLLGCAPKSEGTMKISSPVFADNGSIPAKFTCDGGDTSPPLTIAGIPPSAKSLALIMDDPDAPGGTFDHWIVWNIPANTTAIAEGKAPQGVTAKNGFGKNAYGGPCPPGGEHRYFFKLYALDTTLNLPPSSKKSDLEKAMNGHTVAQAQIVGKYKR